MTTARFPFAGRIRAVLFDAGNTLTWIDHARMAALLTAAGCPCDEPAMRDAEMRARPRLDPWLREVPRREGSETARRYAGLIVEGVLAPQSLTPAAHAAAAARSVDALLAQWSDLWTCPPADAAPTLAALAARGFAVGCVSNSDGRVRSRLEAAGVAEHLACVVDSGIEGVEKPDPRIFRVAADRLGVAPGACVYVGDFLSLDVEGARGAGMEGVLLDPIGAWRGVAAPRIARLGELLARL